LQNPRPVTAYASRYTCAADFYFFFQKRFFSPVSFRPKYQKTQKKQGAIPTAGEKVGGPDDGSPKCFPQVYFSLHFRKVAEVKAPLQDAEHDAVRFLDDCNLAVFENSRPDLPPILTLAFGLLFRNKCASASGTSGSAARFFFVKPSALVISETTTKKALETFTGATKFRTGFVC